MKKVFLATVLFAGILFACSKDKFQTKPQLRLKSVSNKLVPVNGTLEVELEYTDKEGDVDSILVIRKQRLNIRPVSPTVRDSLKFTVPEFPNKDRGEISMVLNYQTHLIHAQSPLTIPNSNPAKREPDTLNLKFVLKDKAGNVSDTLIINNVIVVRQ